MTFRWTDNGLSNLRLFLRTDAVVFVEGADTLTLGEIAGGEYGASLDTLFWRKVFDMFGPAGNLEFRAVGSKTTLRDIAGGVRAGCITSVFVCMDRDWDHLNGSLVQSPGIFHTFGYSWENDAWCQDVLSQVFSVLCPLPTMGNSWMADAEAVLDEYREAMSWPTTADAIAGTTGVSVLPKDKPESLILIRSDKRPEINRARLKEIIRAVNRGKSQRFRSPFEYSVGVDRDCFGHLKAAFFYRVLVFLLRRQRWSHRVAKDHVAAMAIEKFGFALSSYPELFRHYQSQFAYLIA